MMPLLGLLTSWGYFIGIWHPSIAPKLQGYWQSSSIVIIASLNSSSVYVKTLETAEAHKLFTIDSQTSITVVPTVASPTPAIYAMV